MAKALPIIGGVVGAVAGLFLGNPVLGFALGYTLGGVAATVINKPHRIRRTDEDSKVYGWTRIEQTATSGNPIPVIYGEHRVGGNVISQFVSYNFESTKQWDTLRSFGELDVSTNTPLVITTPYTNTEGIQIGSSMNLIQNILFFTRHFEARSFRARIKVELKKVAESTYQEVGTFVLGRKSSTFIVRRDANGDRLEPAQYNVRLTHVDEQELPDDPVIQTIYGPVASRSALPAHLSDQTPRRLPIPNIKIHASFIREVIVKTSDESSLNTLIALGEGRITSVSDVRVNEQSIGDLGPHASYEYLVGLADQSPLANFNNLNTQQAVNEEMTRSYHEVNTAGEVDEVEVEFLAPRGIFHVKRTGKRRGAIRGSSQVIEAQWKLQSEPASAYQDLKSLNMFGATTSPKYAAFRFTAPNGRNEYSFRFRVSPTWPIFDDTGDSNKVFLTRLNDILYESFGYPHTALLGVNVVAHDKYKGSPPNITSLVRGLLVENLNTGLSGYSNNPAWCIADLMTHERYGLGEYITQDDLNIDSFIEAATYYDQLVLDDNKKQVRRFTLNFVADAGDAPQDVLQMMLSTCRSYLVWSNGKFKLRVDKPEAVTQTFNMDNIKKGTFVFSYVPRNSIINQVEVAFRNATRDYEKDFVLVETPEAEAGTEPLRKRVADLRGITNWQQAYRISKYLLLSARYTNIQATFDVALDALFAEPGDVINVTHEVPGWVNKPFKIVSIEERNTKELRLNLVEYHESIYNEDVPEDLGTVVEIDEPNVYIQPPLVRNLDVTESVVEGTLEANLEVSFTPPSFVPRTAPWDHANIYLVSHDDMRWSPNPEVVSQLIGTSKTGQFTIPQLSIKEGYWVYVTSVSPAGVETPIFWAPRQFHYLTGIRTGLPPDVPKFWWGQHQKMIHFHWTPVEDLDGVEYEIREGLTWSAGIVVADHLTGNSYDYPVSGYDPRKYWIKAKDYFDYESATAAVAAVQVFKIDRRRIILERDELALRSGTHLRTKFRRGTLNRWARWVLTLQPSITWDSGWNWDNDRQEYWDLPTYAEGQYTTEVIDLGKCLNIELHIELKFRTFMNWGWCGGYVELEKSSYSFGADADAPQFCGIGWEEYQTAIDDYTAIDQAWSVFRGNGPENGPSAPPS